jgi:hypothetical protein
MIQDLMKIQATIGGGSSQAGTSMHRRFAEEEPSEDEVTDFGLEGRDPDKLVFLTAGVTTMFWLGSHHLLRSEGLEA